MFLWNKSSHPYTTMLISASQRGHLRKKSTLYSVFIQLSTLCGHCQEMVNVGQRYHRTRSGHVGLQRLEHPIVYAWLHYKGFNSFFPQSLCGSFDFWSSAFLKDLMAVPWFGSASLLCLVTSLMVVFIVCWAVGCTTKTCFSKKK